MRKLAFLAVLGTVGFLAYIFGAHQGRMQIFDAYGVYTKMCDADAPIKRCIPICESFAPASPFKR